MTIERRKAPVQQRSAATVGYILDAAAHILAEEGLAALGTNAVARRAGVSIGSLYQYFPGKDGIVAALILASHERIVAGMEAVLTRSHGMSLPDALTALFDMLIALQSGSARLSAILEAEEERLAKTADLLASERRIDALNRAFFGRHLDAAGIGEAGLRRASEDVVAIVRALLDEAARREVEPPGDLRERMMRTIMAYLAPWLPPERSDATGAGSGRVA